MEEILIKKYDNRRLYCVNEGRYVSLPEIRDFVKGGRDVKVVEKTSGRDITKFILTQILLEERCEHIPIAFFRLMIQSQPGSLDLFFRNVFPPMTEAFEAWQKRGPFGGAMPGFPAAGGFPAAFPWMGAAKGEAPSPEPDEPPDAPPEPPPQAPPAGDPRMDELLKRLADLETQVKGKGKKKK